MTANTQFKTLVREWLKAKKPMVAPSTHAAFTLIAENHLVPQFGRMKIASISMRAEGSTAREVSA